MLREFPLEFVRHRTGNGFVKKKAKLILSPHHEPKGIPRSFRGAPGQFQGISEVFQEFKGFQGCFREISGTLHSISGGFRGHQEVLVAFQECSSSFIWFQKRFKVYGVLQRVSGSLIGIPGRSMDVWRILGAF